MIAAARWREIERYVQDIIDANRDVASRAPAEFAERWIEEAAALSELLEDYRRMREESEAASS